MHESDSPRTAIGVTYELRNIEDAASPDARLCLEMWQRLRGNQFAPPWSAFDWSGIPSGIIPHMGVVDVRSDPLDFVYRFWGSAHVTAHGQELTGRSVRDMRPVEEAHSVFTQYRETLIAREARLYTNSIRLDGSETILTETSLRLPFSNDGQHIHQILAFSDIRDSHTGVRQLFEEMAKKVP